MQILVTGAAGFVGSHVLKCMFERCVRGVKSYRWFALQLRKAV